MIATSVIVFWIISEALGMSFIQKLFKRNQKDDNKNNSPREADGQNDAGVAIVSKNNKKSSSSSRRKLRGPRCPDRRLQEWRSNVTRDSSDSDNSDENSGECDDHYTENRKRKLNSQISKLRKHREKLRRRQTDAMTLEQEIRQVVTYISITKQQSEALKEDVLNKKCELKFLGTEVPEGYELEAKKKEPVFYKKYNAVKSAPEARNLLENVRQKMRALQYIELLTYNKYVECKHDLKSNSVKHRSGVMSKNKKRHFGPVKDAIKFHANAENSSGAEEDATDQCVDAIPLHAFATVTIESSPQQQSPVEMTQSTPPTPAPVPLLPAHLFRGPLSLTSSAHMATETFI